MSDNGKRAPSVQFRDRDVESQLDERGPRNQTAARDLQRYYCLLHHEASGLPFSSAEWGYLRDALNGTVAGDSISAFELAAVVEDAAADGLTGKWGVDPITFLDRVRSLTRPQVYAAVDAVERWWHKR